MKITLEHNATTVKVEIALPTDSGDEILATYARHHAHARRGAILGEDRATENDTRLEQLRDEDILSLLAHYTAEFVARELGNIYRNAKAGEHMQSFEDGIGQRVTTAQAAARQALQDQIDEIVGKLATTEKKTDTDERAG